MITDNGTSTIIERTGVGNKVTSAEDTSTGAVVTTTEHNGLVQTTLRAPDGFSFTFPARLNGSFHDLLARVL